MTIYRPGSYVSYPGSGVRVVQPGGGAAEKYYYLDLSDASYGQAAEHAGLNNLSASALTVEAWAMPINSDYQNCIIYKGGQQVSGWGLYMVGSCSTPIRAAVGNGYNNGVATPVVGVWAHYALTFSGGVGGQRANFEDGVRRGYGNTASLGDDAGIPLCLGRLNNIGVRMWRGAIGWVRISNSVRYVGDSFTPPDRLVPPEADANTVALYRLTEGAGLTIGDSSGNGYTLTLTGGAWQPV